MRLLPAALAAATLAGCALAAHAQAAPAPRNDFSDLFSGTLTRQEQKALREARQDAASEKGTAATGSTQDKRQAFRADFERRTQETAALTGAARADALALIAKDRADLSKAVADAKAQAKAQKRAAFSEKDAARTRAKFQKEVSSIERAAPKKQAQALAALRRNIQIQILAQESAGQDAKAAVLRTMLEEVDARLQLLDPSTDR